MWKIFVGFIAFALLALFVIMKGGDKVDMAGEAGHGLPSSHDSAPAAPAASAPAAPATAAPEASAPQAPAAAPAASEPAASK